MNIYTEAGWLDVPHIAEICDKNKINFVFIIGKRQVGKTYNVLKYVVEKHEQFIFLRRSTTEIDMLADKTNSPFEKLYPGEIEFKGSSEYTSKLMRTHNGETEMIGKAAALSTVGHIRGFNGDSYTDVIFDEFIPETHMFKVKDEGTAFLNAHVTITGNREMEGRPAPRFWLLANANDINSPILSAMKIDDIVERMTLRGTEDFMSPERGILILMPESEKVIKERKKGALYRAIGGGSDFADMAFENKFSKNDFSDIGTRPLAEYISFIKIGNIAIHIHKDNKTLYVTEKYRGHVKHEYDETESDIRRFNRDFPDIRTAYKGSRIIFQSAAIKNRLLKIMDL